MVNVLLWVLPSPPIPPPGSGPVGASEGRLPDNTGRPVQFEFQIINEYFFSLSGSRLVDIWVVSSVVLLGVKV